MQRKLICPGCGWVGYGAELVGYGQCPSCDYASPMSAKALLHCKAPLWDKVDMGPFLRAFLAVWQAEQRE